MTRRDFLALTPALLWPKFSSTTFERLVSLSESERWRRLPIASLMVRVGKQLLGTPYVGGTLDQTPDREACVVRLDGLDCVTFFEVCLDFARMIKHGGKTLGDLTREVTFTRYRDGLLDGYLSRLHYTLDWMQNNERKQTVSRVALPGEIELTKPLSFMSDHPNSYSALKANPDMLPGLKGIESRLTKLIYTPSGALRSIEPELQTGDIVGIVTDVPGLDYSHTGLIVREGKTARFLHASSSKKQVVLDGPISEYVLGRTGALGASFVRPIETS